MTSEQLAQAVRGVVVDAVTAGELDVEVPLRVVVVPTRRRGRLAGATRATRAGGAGSSPAAAQGSTAAVQWSTPVALPLAAVAGMPPAHAARLLAARLRRVPGVERVEVRGDGFLDITLGPGSRRAVVAAVLEAGTAYGLAGDDGGRACGPADNGGGRTCGPADNGGRGARRAGDAVLGPPAAWVAAAKGMPRTLANPVLLVQLAHARLGAAPSPLASGSWPVRTGQDPDAIGEADAAGELVGALAGFPRTVERATTAADPSVLGRYLEHLAALALAWLEDATDLELAVAARTVIANGLRILDVAAPDRI